MAASQYAFEQRCSECGSLDLLEDRANGDVVCTNCGVVAESHIMDEGSEWRTFGDNRDASTPACKIYKEAASQHPKGFKGKSRAAMCAAVVYAACRQAGYARTLNEVHAVVADTSKKEIAKCYKFLVEDIKMKVERITSASLVRRFCVALGLGAREAKAAEEMARAAVPSEDGNRLTNAPLRPWDGKSPASVAAAVVYAISSLSLQPSSAREVAQAAAIAEGTVTSTYKAMYAHRAELVPSWFAANMDLQRLPF
ncbi:g5793 [Coccomyxa viridis]|uniref:General transcription factor TFIIB n=1 Tax=Coccomyxa viridis TaxID=1274662 RepID=A0ABP1G0C6_9CHLO